ncbi:1-acyl-sn-glycerol-3-phosphate acyltransferase [Patescibacteria group bacterium]
MNLFEKIPKKAVKVILKTAENLLVKSYVRTSVKQACKRLELEPELARRFQDDFSHALDVTIQRIDADKKKAFVEMVPASRQLIDTLAEIFITKDSELINPQYVEQALDFMEQGGNVLVVQNHTSIADGFVWDALVNREFPEKNNPAHKCIQLAGHVIYAICLHATLAGSMRCIQLISTRYKYSRIASQETKFTQEEIETKNKVAHKKLQELCLEGGQWVALHPEGTRSRSGRLEHGDDKTAKIAEIMEQSSPNGLWVLPVFIQGAAEIFPALEGWEKRKFIHALKPTKCNVICGKPVPWEKICPKQETILAYQNATKSLMNIGIARKQLIHAQIMRLLADLAPKQELRGFW